MTEEVVLDVRDLEKRYGNTEVLRGVSFQVRSGRVLGFVGPNGAGKSTSLRCILGICFADAGTIDLSGEDVTRNPLAARRKTSYLPGETSLYGNMRGADLLRFGLAAYRSVDEDLRAFCIDRFRLPMQRKIRTYSAGQKQLLALTMALSPEVPLYILDEPDKALDASMRHELRAVLRELKSKGRTLIISSHHIAELEGIADDYAFLLDGSVISNDRIETERRRVLRQVRATFASTPSDWNLPEGVQIERDDEGFVFIPPDGNNAAADVRSIVDALLRHEPTSLDYGHASLQKIYEALYLGSHETGAAR